MYVGTEHLRIPHQRGEGIAAQALAKLGSRMTRLGGNKETHHGRRILFHNRPHSVTPRAKRVLEDAYRETMTHSQSYIATEHLLLGALSEGMVRYGSHRTMGVSGDAVKRR